MSPIDPYSVVVLVRDGDATVRIGVSSWQELRGVVRTNHHADDEKRYKDVEAQVVKAMHAGIASS